MKIEYSGEAEDSFRYAIDAMPGYTVRAEWDATSDPSYHVTRRRDIEISGVVTDDDGEEWLTFFPTDKDGNQFDLGDPARKEDRIELALVESLYVY